MQRSRDSVTPLIFHIVSNNMNIILDITFVKIMNLGVVEQHGLQLLRRLSAVWDVLFLLISME